MSGSRSMVRAGNIVSRLSFSGLTTRAASLHRLPSFEALVPPAVDRPGQRHGGPQARLHPARAGHRRRNRDADLEVEGLRGPAEMVGEPRPGGGESLGGDGGHHLAEDAFTADMFFLAP